MNEVMVKQTTTWRGRTLAAAGLALAALSSACAPLNSTPLYQSHGASDLGGDQAVVDRYEQLRDGEATNADEVIVLIDTLPEGIAFDDGAVSVEEGYEHEIVGKFALDANQGTFMMFAGFHDYEDDWRKGMCYWQVPLEWVTLGLWTAVPTSYACHPTPVRSKMDVERDARLMAMSAGADTVLMGFWAVDQEDALGAGGLLIRIDPRMRGDGLKTKPFKHEHTDYDTAASDRASLM